MAFYFKIDSILLLLLSLSLLYELLCCCCCCCCHRYCCVSCFAVVFVAFVAVWVALLLLLFLRPLLSSSLLCFLWLCPSSAVIIIFIVIVFPVIVSIVCRHHHLHCHRCCFVFHVLILVSLIFVIIWFSIEDGRDGFFDKNCMYFQYDRTPWTSIETNTHLSYTSPSVECFYFLVCLWRRSKSSIKRWVGVKAITLAPLFRWTDTISNFLWH